jgi:prevent-host-death family protein
MTITLVVNKTVTLAQATAQISSLVTEAAAGTEITITRHGKPVARIVGAPTTVKRVPGDWGWTGPFDSSVRTPMTDDEMRGARLRAISGRPVALPCGHTLS